MEYRKNTNFGTTNNMQQTTKKPQETDTMAWMIRYDMIEFDMK